MHLYGVLMVLFMTLSTACGLDCFSCLASDSTSCTQTATCSFPLDRCFTINVNGLLTKGCQTHYACLPGITCCEGNLCNSAIPTGPSVVLLLVSSAIITLFL
ncbi:hypothetical protein EXN66_Car011281 [Channa argus]|uniref:UPAR/Ly6 domain-containing protein n=1 Tax=Channa argus TaxID=215402 RepID=A0A6G1PZA8_CHAAH|nr:hypothetical protein EXN66_Car011281 [Channa argus]